MNYYGSLLGKYFISLDKDAKKLYVYKNGDLQQTIDFTSINPHFSCGGTWMSPNGKYIVIIDHYASKVYCYEGS
jgi:hypothetical protein